MRAPLQKMEAFVQVLLGGLRLKCNFIHPTLTVDLPPDSLCHDSSDVVKFVFVVPFPCLKP